jgi:uncharacterized protein with PIN domain
LDKKRVGRFDERDRKPNDPQIPPTVSSIAPKDRQWLYIPFVSRILKAYQGRFRSMLKQAGARRTEQGADWLVAKARRLSEARRLPLSATLTQVYQDLQRQCLGKIPNSNSQHLDKLQARNSESPRSFWCDSGLGGLARWLRAAGYDALWHPELEDSDLLRKAQDSGRTVLTTDSGVMERRLIRDRIVPALWLPPTLSIPQQMEMVTGEFHLELREPRCMACGGELRRVDKQTVRERIPPRTWKWLDEYFLCQRCDHLFWRGTHWGRIRGELEKVFRKQTLER